MSLLICFINKSVNAFLQNSPVDYTDFVLPFMVIGKFFLIPLFHTGPESHELAQIDKYLDSWMNRTQFVRILTDSHSP